MKRFLYERLQQEYEKLTKKELIDKIMVLEGIECKDRCFANECEAGTAIANINALFEAIKDIKNGYTFEKFTTLLYAAEDARTSWMYITAGLSVMNDPGRIDKETLDISDDESDIDSAIDSVISDDYIKAANAAYWAEEDEMKAGIHPNQIKEKIESIAPIKVSAMDWNYDGTRVGIKVGDAFYGVFNYETCEFESTPETRINEATKDFEVNGEN